MEIKCLSAIYPHATIYQRLDYPSAHSVVHLFVYNLYIVSGLPERIWIVGSSIIYWAARCALIREGGPGLNLEPADLVWKGTRGMRWAELQPRIDGLLETCIRPTTLIVHLGGNDLVDCSCLCFVRMVQDTLLTLRAALPDVMLVWSDILTRQFYKGARCQKAMDNKRKEINRKCRGLFIRAGGRAIRHPLIQWKQNDLFRNDGVHLSDAGNAIFLDTMQQAIETFISSGAVSYPPELN